MYFIGDLYRQLQRIKRIENEIAGILRHTKGITESQRRDIGLLLDRLQSELDSLRTELTSLSPYQDRADIVSRLVELERAGVRIPSLKARTEDLQRWLHEYEGWK